MKGKKKKSILNLGGIAKGRKIGTGDEREFTQKVIAKRIVEKVKGKIL